MKALSIRQPWCEHILWDGKDVENRTWSTNFRGDVLIHAGLQVDRDIASDASRYALGGIVGMMTIVDCVTNSNSPWFFGPYGFVIENPRPCPLIKCRGALGFFDVDPEILDRVIAAMERSR